MYVCTSHVCLFVFSVSEFNRVEWGADADISLTINRQGISLIGRLQGGKWSVMVRAHPKNGIQLCWSTPSRDSPCPESKWQWFKKIFVMDKETKKPVASGYHIVEPDGTATRLLTEKEGYEIVLRYDHTEVLYFRKAVLSAHSQEPWFAVKKAKAEDILKSAGELTALATSADFKTKYAADIVDTFNIAAPVAADAKKKGWNNNELVELMQSVNTERGTERV